MKRERERSTDARQPAELCRASLEKARRPGREAACCGDHDVGGMEMKLYMEQKVFFLEVELRMTERSVARQTAAKIR